MNVTTSILTMLCGMGLLMTGCKSSPAPTQDDTPVETSASSQGEESPRTPSKLEQEDWQSAPPGMPADKP